MKPLLNILFKWVVALTLGSIAMLSLFLLAFIMWDGEFLLIADNMQERIFNDNQNK